jgi:hypothetical protein
MKVERQADDNGAIIFKDSYNLLNGALGRLFLITNLRKLGISIGIFLIFYINWKFI